MGKEDRGPIAVIGCAILVIMVSCILVCIFDTVYPGEDLPGVCTAGLLVTAWPALIIVGGALASVVACLLFRAGEAITSKKDRPER